MVSAFYSHLFPHFFIILASGFQLKAFVLRTHFNTKVNTLVHEIAHELLHQQGEGKMLSKQQEEIQAEGTAYVVCKHFGLETKSFTYLALYSADSQQIMENLEAIAKASKEVLNGIGFPFAQKETISFL